MPKRSAQSKGKKKGRKKMAADKKKASFGKKPLSLKEFANLMGFTGIPTSVHIWDDSNELYDWISAIDFPSEVKTAHATYLSNPKSLQKIENGFKQKFSGKNGKSGKKKKTRPANYPAGYPEEKKFRCGKCSCGHLEDSQVWFKCGHEFHSDCLSSPSTSTCPICSRKSKKTTEWRRIRDRPV